MCDIVEKEKCTGCKMCGDLCGHDAIHFVTDNEGFWYPEIDQNKCISCGLCKKKCPSAHPLKEAEYIEPTVYAAWINDVNMRLYSTSGGIYYALAKTLLSSGGYIASCRFTSDWKHAEHTIGKNKEVLMQTVRSKYFQSDTAGIYKKIRELLEDGKRVLFCGTPCQSSALKAFLNKKYDKLITMDFICRGINSQKAFEAFIDELEEKYESKAASIHLKNKRKGWNSLGVLVEFENGQEYYETRSNSYWSLGYIKDNLYMRPVCHQCQYRTIPRLSDFTIGDFWGVQNIEKEDMFNGVSALFVNSERAEMLLNELGGGLHLEERTLQEVTKGNPCLFHSPAEGSKRAKFFELLKTMSFSEAVSECCGKLGC